MTLQIMAITGHGSLQEVERYRQKAQERSAPAAIIKLERRTEFPNATVSLAKFGKNPSTQLCWWSISLVVNCHCGQL
jgi:hypothetical protein